MYLARVTPSGEADVDVELLRPDGSVTVVDSTWSGHEEAAIVAGLPGRYVLSVGGYPAGAGFDVVVSPTQPIRLDVGGTVSLDMGQVLELEVDDDPVTIVVDPAEENDAVVEVMDPRGVTRSVFPGGLVGWRRRPSPRRDRTWSGSATSRVVTTAPSV